MVTMHGEYFKLHFDYGEYFKLTADFYFDHGRTNCVEVLTP